MPNCTTTKTLKPDITLYRCMRLTCYCESILPKILILFMISSNTNWIHRQWEHLKRCDKYTFLWGSIIVSHAVLKAWAKGIRETRSDVGAALLRPNHANWCIVFYVSQKKTSTTLLWNWYIMARIMVVMEIALLLWTGCSTNKINLNTQCSKLNDIYLNKWAIAIENLAKCECCLCK